MKKLLILIILIITSNILAMASNIAEVPDRVYFFTKSKKDLVYEFTSDKNISDQIKIYKIKSNNPLITPETFANINQIIIKIGTKDKPRKTSYDIDISELTQINFPNLKTLNVNQAPLVNHLINIPYPCKIIDIAAPSNTIRNKLIEQLNYADAQAIKKLAASTSMQPIVEPQQEVKLITQEPIIKQPIPTIIQKEQPIVAPISQTASPTLSYWQRWQNWIQKNKARLAISGTAAVGVSAGAYYLWRNPERFNQFKAWFNWSKK